jgi:hypothetical protein
MDEVGEAVAVDAVVGGDCGDEFVRERVEFVAVGHTFDSAAGTKRVRSPMSRRACDGLFRWWGACFHFPRTTNTYKSGAVESSSEWVS